MHKRYTVILVITLVLLAALLLPACKTAPGAPTAPSAAATSIKPADYQAKAGGTLRFLYHRSPVNLGDPAQASSAFDDTWSLCSLESLIDLDEKGQFVPWLASSWEVAPDKKSITFNLRKGVKFHDGTDFNAEAVKFNFERLNQEGIKTDLSSIKSVDVINDNTVRINLSMLEAPLLYILAGRSGEIVSPTAIKTHDKSWLLTNIVGTGPFKLASYQRDVLIKFQKNQDYWNSPLPYLDEVNVKLILDRTTEGMAFQAGEGDAIITGGSNAVELINKGFSYTTRPGGTMFFIVIDGNNPDSPYYNVKVRQAVSYAINSAELAQTVGRGAYQPLQQFAYPGSWAYNSKVAGYPFNPAKAKELVKEAGYPNGFETTLFDTPGSNPAFMPAVQGYLKEAGINAKIQVGTLAQAIERDSKGWKNGLMNANIVLDAATDPAQALRSSFSGMSGRYVSVLHPKEVDDKLSQAITELDLAKRKPLMQDIQALMFDKYATITCAYLVKDMAVKYEKDRFQDMRYFEEPSFARWRPDIVWKKK